MGTTELNFPALGRRIRKQRKALNLTQNTLSEMAGVSLSFLGHIERGSRKMSIDTFTNIVNALNTTANDLLRDSLADTAIDHPCSVRIEQQYSSEVKRLIDESINHIDGMSPEMNINFSSFDRLIVSLLLSAFYYGCEYMKSTDHIED